MITGLVHVFIVTVMFILNFLHCEITACYSDNKQNLILSYDSILWFLLQVSGYMLWQLCVSIFTVPPYYLSFTHCVKPLSVSLNFVTSRNLVDVAYVMHSGSP